MRQLICSILFFVGLKLFFDNSINIQLENMDLMCCEVCGGICDSEGKPLQKNLDTCFAL